MRFEPAIESDDIFYVVGDVYEVFTYHQKVLLFREVIDHIWNGKDYKNKTFILGQGLSYFERKKLESLSKKRKIRNIVNQGLKLASNPVTHKHKTSNIMISDPQKIAKDRFNAHLMVDAQCAEMSDHITGRHIQGMVLIEAARQMMLACAEKL